jgi:hypothetical protein
LHRTNHINTCRAKSKTSARKNAFLDLRQAASNGIVYAVIYGLVTAEAQNSHPFPGAAHPKKQWLDPQGLCRYVSPCLGQVKKAGSK